MNGTKLPAPPQSHPTDQDGVTPGSDPAETTTPAGGDGFRSLRVTSAVYDRVQALRRKLLEDGASSLPETLRRATLHILSCETPTGRPRGVTVSVVVELALDAADELIGRDTAE